MDALDDKTVLVVGPDKSLQRELRKALPGADIELAPDSKNALAHLDSHTPELVVLDEQLPKQDGYEVLSQLHKRKSLADVPVVFVAYSPVPQGASDATWIAREDLSTLSARISETLAERKLRNAFSREYADALADAQRGAGDLTEEQRKVLQSAGFPLEGEVKSGPLAARAARYDAIIDASLSTEQAAKKLGVNASRIRQRLLATPPQLYGIRRDNAWWLPRFQFGRKGLVPQIAHVIARLDPQLDPVAVDTWFRTAHVDLEDGDRTLSPLEWLTEGRSVDAVAALAEEL